MTRAALAGTAACLPRWRSPRVLGDSLGCAGGDPAAVHPAPDSPDLDCDQSYADDSPRGGPRIEFGIGPRLAGEVGASQVSPTVPEDKRIRDRRLLELKGENEISVRLNRLFQADGRPGIREFQRMARHYGSLGFDVTVQVRYHPAPEENGDVAAWLDYVRRVVRAFGPNRHVTALQITNEVNISFSPNTSDGAYENAVEALVRGVPAAKREARRRGAGSALWAASDCAGRRTGSGSTPTREPFIPSSFEKAGTPCSKPSRRRASATCRRVDSARPPAHRRARLSDGPRTQRGDPGGDPVGIHHRSAPLPTSA